MKKLAIIVPCYNEDLVIAESYRRTKASLSVVPNPSEIIYINDGSKDRTGEMLDEIAHQDSSVKVIHFSRNFGHQPAVTAGIHHCDADLAIVIDADMQDPPELFADILALQEKENANVVYCVRKSRDGENFMRLFLIKLFYRTMNAMSEVRFPLDTGDFRLIDRRVMDEFNKFHEKGKYIRGLISWMGFKQVPFYYEREARIAGVSKYPLKMLIRFASNALLYFSKKPLKMAMGLGFFAVVIGIILAAWFVFGKIYGYVDAETGWTSIMITILFFGGVQLITIGVLGQYIGTLFDEIKARPEYIVNHKINFD